MDKILLLALLVFNIYDIELFSSFFLYIWNGKISYHNG